MQLKCGKCGKVFSLRPGEAGKTLLCSACGSLLNNPLPPEVRARPVQEETRIPTAPPAPINRLQTRPLPWIVAATCLAGVVVLAAVLLSTRKASEADGDRYWRTHYDELITLKGDAERLAIAGKLADAHAKYQELEKRLAGKTIKDARLWDMTERAKQDQDRIYGLLMLQVENRVAAERAALQARLLAAAQEQAPPSTPYPSRFDALNEKEEPATRPAVSVAPQTRPAAAEAPPSPPATRPQVAAQPPAAHPAPLPIAPVVIKHEGITDEQVGQSIQKAVDFLLANFEADQIKLAKSPGDTYREGLNALVVYALLKAGQTIPDPRLNIHNKEMADKIERMKDSVMLVEAGNLETPVTYARSLRVAALAVYNRTEDRKTMEADVTWLLKSANDGSYTYNDELNKLTPAGQLPRYMGPGFDGSTLYYIDPSQQRPTLFHNGERVVPVPPGTVLRSPGAGLPGYQDQSPDFDKIRSRIYNDRPDTPWDNSNTQYAHMAVGFAADCGANIPADYWKAAMNHWRVWELQSGQWTYDGKSQVPLYSMTAGGIASLLITMDRLEIPMQGAEVGKPAYSPWLAAGLNWLDREDNCMAVARNAKYIGYNLFGLSRAGLGSGYKYFGGHDWYRELAGKIIATQYPNGAFGREAAGNEALIDTAYIVLFLSSGRPPVLYNKLRYDGPWNNRARDVANLAQFATRELERPVNWQVTPIDRDWTDWMDAPVLYISGHEAPKMGDKEYAKLKAFVEAGGLIFTHADGNALRFNEWVSATVRRLFPGQLLQTLPPTHEIYSVQYKLGRNVSFQGVSNGSRLLLVHSGSDISAAWQLRDGRRRPNFEAGINVFLYAAGKPNLRNRLSSPLIDDVSGDPLRSIEMARLVYGGNWDPEPYAFTRFGRAFRRHTGWRLDVHPAKLAELAPDAAPVAHLTGTAAMNLSDVELTALRKYVEGGGVLVIDACGGNTAFLQSAGQALGKAFSGAALEPLKAEHPILHSTYPGMAELPRPVLRPIVTERQPKAGRVDVLTAGQGLVILCPLDVTTGLLGTHTWGVMGYEPDYAEKLMQNILIWRANAR